MIVGFKLIWFRELKILEKVFFLFNWRKVKLFFGFVFYLKKCGICFRIIIILIFVNMFLIIDEGK